jgi:hypothetical protein
MNTGRTVLRLAALSLFILALSSAAQAQATRTWVSGVGDDVNPCSRTAPCKTWAGAISRTAAGGEIDALDPGGYGTLTITKSITVDGAGTHASGLNAGGVNGFNINDSATATPNTSIVRLRNLSINGAGATTGLNGIRFVAGKALHVENVVIDRQSGDGISFTPAAAGVVFELYVRNLTVRNVTSDGIEVSAAGAGSIALASIDDSSFAKSGNGVRGGANSRVHLTDCQIALMGGFGVSAEVASSEVNVSNSLITNSPSGVRANGGVARVSKSVVTGNTTGLNRVSGTLETFQNNMVRGNTTDLSAGVTPVPQN